MIVSRLLLGLKKLVKYSIKYGAGSESYSDL